LNFKIKNSRIAFRGKVFDVKVDEIEFDSGNKGVREVALHNGGAVVVAVTDENKIVMVNQFRWPFSKFLLELPAGKLEPGEDPQICASRELTEETGFNAGKIVKFGSIFTTPGFCNEELHIYLAQNLTAGEHNREEGEYGMETHEYTLDEIDEMIVSGEIKDSKTLAGIQYYKLYKAGKY